MNQFPFNDEEWQTCLKVLTALKDNPLDNPDNQTFKTLITLIHKKAKKSLRKEGYEAKKQEDVAKLEQTTIIANAQDNTTFYTHQPNDKGGYTSLNLSKKCYACHSDYTQLHFFYHKLCPNCAEEHYQYRQLEVDFKDYQVILTGGRVKIGFATALKFLRSGAKVLVTTRFPAVALEQFKNEADYDIWHQNLIIYGLDLRNLKAVYAFTDYCKNHLSKLDILVNNAAQTIKYPPQYYQPISNQEHEALENGAKMLVFPNKTPINLSQIQLLEAAPQTEYPLNRFGQPVDFREKNSWNASLEDIDIEELLEVNLINQISPYILISELTLLLQKSQNEAKHIINVTSSEGQFSYANKTIHHPHTNMTKAALNMLTRTSAIDYVEKGIFMNAVDVGWVSTGANEEKRQRLFKDLRIPPLDSVDGAMRVMHPILEVENGDRDLFGKLLKNYKVVDW